MGIEAKTIEVAGDQSELINKDNIDNAGDGGVKKIDSK